MLKSGVSQDKKKDEEGGNGSTPETVTRLTRNRLLQQQRQKNSADGLDDPKSENTEGVKKTKADEDGDADIKTRPVSSSTSLDGDKEANSKPEPHLSSKTKTEDTIPALKPRREKEKKATNNESKDENGSEKKVFVMKTRSGRSSQAVINMSAANQQNKGDDENGKNLKKKKGNSAYRRSKKLYDEAGALLASGKDYCDCLEVDCPGCHFPCKKCGSEKCGTECRCERAWVYDEVKIEGTGIIIKNHAC